MTTALSAARQELSRQLNDDWRSTTTSAGATTNKTLVDTALIEKQNAWIGKDMYDLITSATDATVVDDERQIASLSNTNGTLALTRAHTARIATSVGYEIHRLFTASDRENL
ncbi:hypothetical protein LCGC14_2323160 [marine sediment metagenome]|uniref:Uncharacterized protein n=1 Tax=marine sediment metagenome TaxID=412755 RepID=A0A0F9CHR3_9ZZZZ